MLGAMSSAGGSPLDPHNPHMSYQSPLNSRYASSEMKFNFSDQAKFSTFGKLWVALAEAQREAGVLIDGQPIAEEQLSEMRAAVGHIDFEVAAVEELRRKHDVMAHVYAYALAAPLAAPIIHLGATSCFVTDNTDLVQIRNGMDILLPKIARCIASLAKFASEHRSLATLGYTHYQPAQLTTVGKRACLWISDLLWVEKAIARTRDDLRFRGAKGATGTQASYLQLFDESDAEKSERVKQIDAAIAEKMGFKGKLLTIVGQTYSRAVDVEIIDALGLLGSSTHKMCSDLRLLAHDKEMDEPFETASQIGSSAMPYKRNPMRCERVCSLARHLITLKQNMSSTHATQWLERSLDDSANRRLTIAEAFLASDAVAQTLQNICEGIIVHKKVIEKRIQAELPFMATENFIMAMVRKKESRQTCHEKIRVLSQTAGNRVKNDGLDNNLIELIRADPYFAPIKDQIDELINPETFIGRAPEQVDEFIREEVEPVLDKYRGQLDGEAEFTL